MSSDPALDAPRQELVCKFRRRTGFAKEVALAFLAAHRCKQAGCLIVLDAFGDHRKREILCERDGRTHNCSIAMVADEITDERAIDFESIERERLEIAQAAETGPEIVEYEPDAEPLQALHDRQHPFGIVEQYIFRYFQFEQRWRKAGRAEDAGDFIAEISARELRRGEVDADADCVARGRPRAALGAGGPQHP